MTHDAQELLQKALTLPDNERAELAGNLIAAWMQSKIQTSKLHGSRRSHAALTKSDPAKQRRFRGKRYRRKAARCSMEDKPLRIHLAAEQEYL